MRETTAAYVPLDEWENPDMFLMLNPPPVVLDEVQRTPGLFRICRLGRKSYWDKFA